MARITKQWIGRRWECDACGGSHLLAVQYSRCGLLWHLGRAIAGDKGSQSWWQGGPYVAGQSRRWHLRECLRTLLRGNGQ